MRLSPTITIKTLIDKLSGSFYIWHSWFYVYRCTNPNPMDTLSNF